MKKEEIEQVDNPIVRRALQRRCSNFMFNYGDADEQVYSDSGHNNHTESRGSSDGRYPLERKSQGKGSVGSDGYYSEYCEGILYKEYNEHSDYSDFYR